MESVRESYELPERPPLPFRQIVVMFAVAALALVLWLVLPHSAITVALIVIALLVAVFLGVGMVLRSRELDCKPDRDPVPPPSAERA